MNYRDFLEILMPYQKLQRDFSELYQMGFNLLDSKYQIEPNVSRILDASLNSHFTEEGVDWINWFIYENEWGQKDWSKYPKFDEKTGKIIEQNPLDSYGAKDEEGNPICYSFESTWDYVKKYLKNEKNT